MSVWSSSLANVQRPSPSNLPAAGQISSKAPEESWKKIDQMGPDADVFATNVESGRVDSYDQRVCRQHWHCLQVERQNLLQACRVAVKALVDRVCFAVVDDDCVELAQFMAVAENIFFHGYKGQESNSLLLGDDPDEDFWIVLRTGLTNSEAIKTVDNMGDVMTDLGKCRAWLRTCLVQKSLGTCYSQILNNQQLTRAYYSSSALFRREEGHLVFGLLQALDSVDFCLCLKDNADLDLPVRTVVDYSYFIQFRASAVGNLADEGEWWNALEADAIPHVPRDSQSAKANAVVAAALSRPSRTSGDASSLDTTLEARNGGESAEAASTSEAGQPKPGKAQPKVAYSRAAPGVTTDIVGEEQTDGPSPPASSTLSPTARRELGAALNSLDGSNGVEMSDFIRLQHHVSREREQRNYCEELVKQRDKQLHDASHDKEALLVRIDALQQQAAKEHDELEQIILELHEKVADLTLENRQLSQDLLTATTPTEGLFSSLFSRRTASMSSTQQQPQLSHNAASLPDRSTASSRGNSASGDATELRNATDLARSSSTSPSTATASDGALDE